MLGVIVAYDVRAESSIWDQIIPALNYIDAKADPVCADIEFVADVTGYGSIIGCEGRVYLF